MKHIVQLLMLFLIGMLNPVFGDNFENLNNLIIPDKFYNYIEISKTPFGVYSCYNTNYNSGFALICNKSHSSFVSFNLDKKYNQFSFVLFVESCDNSCVNCLKIKGDSNVLFQNELPTNYGPIPILIDVSNVDNLYIEYNKNNSKVIFLNPMLSHVDNTLSGYRASDTSTYNKILGVDIQPMDYRHNINFISFDENENVLLYKNEELKSGFYIENNIGLWSSDSYCSFDLDNKFKTLSFNAGPISINNANDSLELFILVDSKIVFNHIFRAGDRIRKFYIDINNCKYLSLVAINSSVRKFVISEVEVSNQLIKSNDNDTEKNQELDVVDVLNDIALVSFLSDNDRHKYYFDKDTISSNIVFNNKNLQEGFVLKSVSGSSNHFEIISGESYAIFDFNSKYDYLSFSYEWYEENNSFIKDTLYIFLDSMLTYNIPLYPNISDDVIIPINKCQYLTFYLSGNKGTLQPSYFFHNLYAYKGDSIVHKGGVLSNTVSNSINRELKPFFYIYNGYNIYHSYLSNIGRCSKYNFYILNYVDAIDNGIILKTRLYERFIQQVTNNFRSAFCVYSLKNPLLIFFDYTDKYNKNDDYFVEYDSEGNLYSHSCATYKLYNNYDTIKFSVGICAKFNDVDILENNFSKDIVDTLIVKSDGEIVAEIILNSSSLPNQFSIPINKCSNVTFWLKCNPKYSLPYLIYDMEFIKQ